MKPFDFILGYKYSAYKQSRIYIDDNGYYRFKDSNKLVHRWVAERKVGRRLKPEEVVHHINRNKRDNSPGNLEILPNQEVHDELHRRDARNFGTGYSYLGKRKQITLYYILIGWWNK